MTIDSCFGVGNLLGEYDGMALDAFMVSLMWFEDNIIVVEVGFVVGDAVVGSGVIGEYVGRAFLYQSKEPQFIIKDIKKSN